MSKSQVIHIHGGNPFDSREQYYAYLQKEEFNPYEVKKRWSQWIAQELSDVAEVFLPSMPAKQDADYLAWKIWFEKLFPYLGNEKIILTGKSLGTIFLIKYLSENTFPKPIHTIHLVALVFDGEGIEDEGIANFILDPEKLQNVLQQVGKIHLWHSVDDPVCPWHHVEKYQQYFPDAILHQFEDRGHFGQSEFPELLVEIQKEIS